MEAHAEAPDDPSDYHGGGGLMEQTLKVETYRLIEVIRDSRTYTRYRNSVEALKKYPDIMNRLMDLRQKTIDLYEHAGEDVLVAESERLAGAYEELQKMPEVNEFLEAEEALVRALQTITDKVLDSIDMVTPNPEG